MNISTVMTFKKNVEGRKKIKSDNSMKKKNHQLDDKNDTTWKECMQNLYVHSMLYKRKCL